MARITAVKPQKGKGRVNIYLDGKFGFGIDLENFVKLGLRVEQELTEEEIERIIGKAEYAKTLTKMIRFGSVRPRSKKEYDDWFRRKAVPASIHKRLLVKVRKLGFLDDEAFARWWVRMRIEFKAKSKRELKQELRMKGIGRETIEMALGEVEVNELEAAKKLLARRTSKGWEKNAAYLARKGFDWETIKSVKLALEQEK